jgi:pimeloyl-ACP methyl ester carboxylesterase
VHVVRHHRIRVDEVGLHAVSQGAGRTVVLIHGFPQHSRMWRSLMPALADAGFRAVAIDQRGMGGSDVPAAGFDKRTCARDVIAWLDALGVERAAVVGYDHGGGTALALGYLAPERVERIAVLEYSPPGFGYETGLVAAPGNVNWQLAFFTHPDVAVQFISGKERELLAWYFWHWSHDPDAVGADDFEDYVRQLQRPGALRGGFMHFAAVFEDAKLFDAWAKAGPLPMPVLALGGEAAAGPWIEGAMKRLATHVSGGVIGAAGHWLVEEQPQAVADALLAFLG